MILSYTKAARAPFGTLPTRVLGMLPQLGLVVFLVFLNAAFAGTELALVSLREGQLQGLERRSKNGRVLAQLARNPNQFLATIQIGITLAGFMASAAAAVSLAEPLKEPLSFLGQPAEPVAIVVVTLLLAYVTLVFGELAPKRVAMQRAEQWGLLAARPLAFVSTLTRPIVWLLSRSTDIAVRLMGGDPYRDREEVTEEELRDMIAGQDSFTPRQRLIINGAFEIADRTLQEVLRPRRDVFVLDADDPGEVALPALAASGYSRAPVARGGGLDEVTGMVHLRDLLSLGPRPVSEAATEICAFPETGGVLNTLHEMQNRRCQIAVVVDEHGSAAGIVTMEDLIEELVGEIYDETDRDVIAVKHEPDGTLVLPGQFPLHDLPDIGMGEVVGGSYTTVAGLILDQLGRVPEGPGARVEIEGWTLEVSAVERHAITEIRATPHPFGPKD